MKKNMLEQLEEIARAYCKKMNYTFIFANEYKFGFEDEQEKLKRSDKCEKSN